jgi:hypothetical protein
MGSFSLNGTMYAMRPHSNNSLSQTPTTVRCMDVVIENVMYRIHPVYTRLDFSDVGPSKYKI